MNQINQQQKKILDWFRSCPDILSDEEWKWLGEKVQESLTLPPDGDGFRLSEEEDPGAWSNAREFYTNVGGLIAEVQHLVDMLYSDDPEFINRFKSDLEPRMGVSEERKELLYKNIKSERGQKLLSLVRDTADALLEA